jgi:uncharacterized protein (DUF1330 family)
MPAYVVLFRESPVRDPAEMQKYAEIGARNGPPPTLKPLAVYGAQTHIEGDNPPDGVVVLEFPSVQDAKDWYYGPAYQEAVKHRLAAADYRGVIVEGFDPAALAG